MSRINTEALIAIAEALDAEPEPTWRQRSHTFKTSRAAKKLDADLRCAPGNQYRNILIDGLLDGRTRVVWEELDEPEAPEQRWEEETQHFETEEMAKHYLHLIYGAPFGAFRNVHKPVQNPEGLWVLRYEVPCGEQEDAP